MYIKSSFLKNVINVWGDKGSVWLNQLPQIIEALSEYWCLSDVTVVDNMSYNYVAKANQNKVIPVVLKISCDKQLIEDESRALKHFNGSGAIKLLDIHDNLNALLLEQAIPGTLLKSMHTDDIENTITCYANVVKRLASSAKPDSQYTHVKKWCEAIDRMNDERIKPTYITAAKKLSDFLLGTATEEYLCHGDLHLENIIHRGDTWLSIDPKGIIGEMAFEAAAFDLLDKSECPEPLTTIQDKVINRISLLASALNLDKNRLLAWFFLRIIISAQWFIEDNGDPNEMLNLAAVVYPLVAMH